MTTRPQAQQTQQSGSDAAASARLRSRRAAIVSRGTGISSWNEADRTFEFVLASEAPCRTYRRVGWDEYVEVDEVLPMAALANLDTVAGCPLLRDHNSWSIDNVLGRIRSARIEGDKLICTAQLSARDDVADIARDIADGILTDFSVGFDIDVDGLIQQRDNDRPLVSVTAWTVMEASLVAIPADRTATTRTRKPGKSAKAAGQRSASETAEVKDEEKRDGEVSDETLAALDAAEAAFETAKEALDEARAAAGVVEDEVKDEERAAEDEAAKDETKDAPVAKDDEKADPARAQVIAFTRGLVLRRGYASAEDFDAYIATAPSTDAIREIAQDAIKPRSAQIDGTASGVSEGSRSEPEIRSIRQNRAAREAARKAR